ncbi:histidine kinase [Hahella sp. CCB-MM4]|uniref:sensor histidine kinase n=1 Tax=Hahella sp. (strain CCB-MM4) TaxID=1926491 RepID=UPI000B9ACAEA|nr:HAMP domain-containing sensor histidine kinase [Hahella sp. CCB-MM4]OZG69730.1 histidine kinase [Hahella sp. CCB-MM4]
MKGRLRYGLTPWRLRLVVSLVFLALVIPSGVLIWQTQSQIKWEAFHQYRILAEELADRIDEELQKAVAKEEAHSYADYQFLVLEGDPNTSNYVQRSPLAGFPVESDIPGVMGYFQVDAEGNFTTPLLPETLDTSNQLGLSADDISRRTELRDRLLEVLSRNQLVPRDRESVVETKPSPSEDLAQDQEQPESDAGAAVAYDAAEPQVSAEYSSNDAISAPEEMAALDEMAVPDQKAIALNEEATAPASAPSRYSQQVFDQLSSEATKAPQPKLKAQARVEDLNLKKDTFTKLQQQETDLLEQKKKTEERQGAASIALEKEVKRNASARASRKEQTAMLEGVSGLSGGGESFVQHKIRIFESEVDPFELAQLESGEFVLFRKVWRDGQRLIQGAIIDQNGLIEGLLSRLFRETALAQMSNLVVAYRGNVLSVIPGTSEPNYRQSARELDGTLLHQARMSAPFGEFQLLWSINHLPAGPGAKVVIWSSLVLFSVLVIGFWVLYHLGMKQILLTRQQQDFVSSVSHELKTPLTSIRMYGEMLREGWVSEEKKREYYDFIHDESERLSRLIANVLQLARMERNDLKLELKPFTVKVMMDMMRSKIHSQVERAGFRCSYDISPGSEDCELLVDPDAFTQVIINLVDNAIKFSSQAESKVIEIRAEPRSNKAVIWSVRDHGPGIAKSQMKKIFQLFYRSGNELTRETIGTGIGLALVRQLVRAMGGEVDVINKSPGAEFQVKLPCR